MVLKKIPFFNGLGTLKMWNWNTARYNYFRAKKKKKNPPPAQTDDGDILQNAVKKRSLEEEEEEEEEHSSRPPGGERAEIFNFIFAFKRNSI